ncbi:MAG: hypothetical protein HZB75_03290 [Candidatus Saccharibacteria bacterium]|nr:MAG: hypothetical protein HZB75_03290 [Candidatus Saccharibacteria bacterium]
MLTIFAHAGHSHSMNDFDHCLPVMIGAGIVIVVLVAVIVYFLIAWQPKAKTKNKKK